MKNKQHIKSNLGHKVLKGVLCLLAISLLHNFMGPTAWAQAKKRTTVVQKTEARQAAQKKGATKKSSNKIAPQIPSANRNVKGKVFLEYADVLSADELMNPDYQVLKGNVKFRKQNMFMYCDSAHYYQSTNSLDAFGHVKMEQGDTLFVYADVLYYSGADEVAQLRNNVRMINRDVTLYTDSLDYDMVENLGYYFEGGKIVDSRNELSSVYGQYCPDTKQAEFLFDVELVNDQYTMKTDTLNYNTSSHIADILGRTTIVSDSNIIYTSLGQYNTSNEDARLYNRSLVVGKDGVKITGDTLYYNRNTGLGEAMGNMLITDSVNSTILDGDYGYHNEQGNNSFVTKRARAREFSKGDTLYLHGDTLRTYFQIDSVPADTLGNMRLDSIRLLTAYPKVRFFRGDVQGVCDSMSLSQRDSVLRMYQKPVIWSDERQVSGNEIFVHYADSTVDWAQLPNFGFVVEHIDDIYYNQIKGKDMLARFEEGELRLLDVKGNVQLLMYPMEDDSTYNKLVDAESSFMIVKLLPKQELDKITMWPEVTGNVIPLFLAKKNQMFLSDFNWYEAIRPKDPDDIFNVGDAMKDYMDNDDKPSHRNRKSSK